MEVVAVLPGGKRAEEVTLTGRVTPFAFAVPSDVRAVLLDPDYRVLRWTGDFKASRIVAECRVLRSLGRFPAAMARLDSCLAADRGADGCRVELGICQEKAGQRDQAESTFRSVVAGYRLYPTFSPAVPAALLHLGELCDLAGRRDQALGWYRQVLEVPEAAGEHERARALIRASYAPPAPPGPEVLRRYEGTFVFAGTREYVLRVNENGILTISGPEIPEAGLEWTGGTRFELPTRAGVSLEFAAGKDGSVDRATIRLGSMELPFLRKTP